MEYNDGEIYYDNIEIMEKIAQRKIAKMAISTSPSTPTPDIAQTTASVVRPPVLPPKKKNMGKHGSSSDQRQVEVTESAPKPKVLPKTQQTPPTNSIQPSRKPAQAWNHPGLLRTRSIVEEPLAPIVEEDPYQENSPRRSVNDALRSESFLDFSTMRTRGFQLQNTDKDDYKFGSVPEQPGASKGGSANALHSTIAQSSAHVGLRENQHSSSRENTFIGKAEDQDLILDEIENENSVRPYGMVDVAWIEMNSGNEFAATGSVQLPVTLHRLPGDAEDYSFRSSNGESIKQVADSKVSGSGDSEKSSDSSTHESRKDIQRGICAYMSIPVHTDNIPFAITDRSSLPSSPISPQVPNRNLQNVAIESYKYKDDEYIYNEIDDTVGKSIFLQTDGEMQKTLTNINEVLETIGNEDISHTSSPTFKRFPMPTEQVEDDRVRYDNFFFRGEDARTFLTVTDARPKLPAMTQKAVHVGRPSMRTVGPIKASGLSKEKRVEGRSGRNESERSEAKQNDYFESIAYSLPKNGHQMSNVNQDRNHSEDRSLSGKYESSSKSITSETSYKATDSVRHSRQSVNRSANNSLPSKLDLDASSEADSISYSLQHSDTLPSRRKSIGNSISSIENLKGSTRSLGRSNSCERKRSSFRSKFKFRSRSKSQERFYADSDSLGHVSNVSDVDEKTKTPKQRGSRLRRRLSRKRLENREANERKSGDEYEEREAVRSSTPVSFIRKLLRKSKEKGEDNSQSSRKSQMTSSGSEDSFSRTSSSSKSQHVVSDGAKERQMISPPSRRARKMLHSRQARGKEEPSNSSNSESDCENRRYNKGDLLKQSDEYLEPCETKDNTANFHFAERGRKPIPQRAKFSKGRRTDREHANVDKSGSFHREKYRALVSLNAQTLKKITEKWLTDWRNKLPVGGFLITSWADIVIASKLPQCILEGSVIYEAYFSTNPGHRLACQIFEIKDVNHRLMRQLENCSTLTAHPNLCSVCSHFHCQVPGSLMHPPRDDPQIEALSVVLANVPATSLATYISRLRDIKVQKQVHKQILLMMLQLLQALENLSQSGFGLTKINANHLIVTQEMGLLQILPHMESINNRSAGFRNNSDGERALMQQLSGLLSWMLEASMDSRDVFFESNNSLSHSSALKRISNVLRNPPHDFTLSSLQSLVQCALWGPRSVGDMDIMRQNSYDALASWIDVKQAELVNNIAVLFSAKTDVLPIYMFYKHQYFSGIDPKVLFQSLRLLGRI